MLQLSSDDEACAPMSLSTEGKHDFLAELDTLSQKSSPTTTQAPHTPGSPGRRHSIRTNDSPAQPGGVSRTTGTDNLLRTLWHDRMSRGDFFAYHLTRAQLDAGTSQTDGKWGFIVQFNGDRGVKKRRGIDTREICEPFNAAAFNFTKVALEEVLIVMAATSGEDWPHGMVPVLSLQGESPHLVIINAAPIEELHVLFCPRCFDRLPQQLTPDTVESAIAFAANTSDPELRMGFNSLLAAASVNHLHIHLYRLQGTVAVERAETQVIRELTDGSYSRLVDYPLNGLVFEFQCASRGLHNCRQTLQLLHSCISVIQKQMIPHNMVILNNGHKVVLFPQLGNVEIGDGMQAVGCMECMGHFVAFNEETQERLDEKTCCEVLSSANIPQDRFELLVESTIGNLISAYA